LGFGTGAIIGKGDGGMILNFRGWHKELEQMIYSKEICGHIEYSTNLIDALNTMLNEDDYDIEVMQSTGLTDKNGIEIFEGDIVRYTSSIMAKNEWHKKITRYGSALVMASFDDKTRDSSELLNLLSIHKGIEILGNIYQNPELLEEL
jgi:uncharacterized phage protein (TIGR01671 family)